MLQTDISAETMLQKEAKLYNYITNGANVGCGFREQSQAFCFHAGLCVVQSMTIEADPVVRTKITHLFLFEHTTNVTHIWARKIIFIHPDVTVVKKILLVQNGSNLSCLSIACNTDKMWKSCKTKGAKGTARFCFSHPHRKYFRSFSV